MADLKKVKKIYSDYGRHPLAYRLTTWLTFFGKESRLRRELFSDIKKGDKVLDVGCGSGYNFKYIKENGGNVFGIDLSEEMLDCVKEDVKLIKGDISQLNLNLKFDVVSGVLSFSVIPDLDNAIKNIKNLLRNEGKILILDIKKFNGFFRFLNPLIRLVWRNAVWNYDRDLGDILSGEGFNVEKKEWFSGFVYMVKGKKL